MPKRKPVPGSNEAIRASSAKERQELEKFNKRIVRNERNRRIGNYFLAGSLATVVAGALYVQVENSRNTSSSDRPPAADPATLLKDPNFLIERGACADELELEAELTTVSITETENIAVRDRRVKDLDMYRAAAKLAAEHDVSCYSSYPLSSESYNPTPNFDVVALESGHLCVSAIRAQINYASDPGRSDSDKVSDWSLKRLELQTQLADEYSIPCK